jgi:hypothetical protein
MDQPGILEGFDRPPTIFHASSVFIYFFFLFLFYFLIVASLRPAGAWRLVLGALNPVRFESSNHLKNFSQLAR